jgi:lipid II:glycine glycyltransferase (peptidoglycan interpeptide bridge formation enzyme)
VATAFTRPDILARLVDSVQWWGVRRGAQLVLAWPVCTVGGRDGVRPDLSYYVGPLLDWETPTFKYHRYWSVFSECFAHAVDQLVERYSEFTFSLPSAIDDLRPLLWVLQERGLDEYLHIRPCYSAVLDLSGDSVATRLFAQLARNRKREISKNEGAALELDPNCAGDEIVELYRQTLTRQGETPSRERLEALDRLLQTIRSTAGRILAYRDSRDARLMSVIAMLYGPREANNVLCVADESARDQGLTSWTTWQGILAAIDDGRTSFDFNGANSPSRAADKHYYGARASLYFSIRWQRP